METVTEIKKRGAAYERVRAYLGLAGVIDEKARERLSILILEATEAKGQEGLEQSAMEAALGQEASWLAALNRYAAAKGYALPDAFAGWRLREILKLEPEAFLKEPEAVGFGAIIDKKGWRATPEVIESEMPAQELGGLPRPLRRSFWRKVWMGLIRPLRYGGG